MGDSKLPAARGGPVGTGPSSEFRVSTSRQLPKVIAQGLHEKRTRPPCQALAALWEVWATAILSHGQSQDGLSGKPAHGLRNQTAEV